MSLTWMIVIAALIAVEKLLPSKALANRSVATVLLILGLGVALFPKDVPALTLPRSAAAAMHAMHNMGMGSMSKHGGTVPSMGQHMSAMQSVGKHGGSMPSMGQHASAMPGTGGHATAMPGMGPPQSHH
jgi:hypothetical protein